MGCKGREEYGIELCAGTSCDLLDLRRVPKEDTDFHFYVGKMMQLYDKAATDHNRVMNILNHIVKTEYLDDSVKQVLGEYISLHKRCGIYLYTGV
jgi:hypothetical protein